jgi:hypothetical protein
MAASAPTAAVVNIKEVPGILVFLIAKWEKGGATAGAAEKQRRNRPSRGRIPTVFGGRVETLRFLHTFVVAGGHKTVGCAENIWFLHTH